MSPNEVRFETDDLSNVSFLNTDITRVKFGEDVVWGKNKNESDKFRVMDEGELENPPEYVLFNWNDKLENIKHTLISFLSETLNLDWIKNDSDVKNSIYYSNTINVTSHDGNKSISLQLNHEQTTATVYISGKKKYQLSVKKEGDELNVYNVKKLSTESIKAIYRNLRENYEYRLRYDEAGQFFVREMEIKRKYREKFSTYIGKDIPKQNNWLRRNFIGLYHSICNYGESTTRPLIYFGIITSLSTAYWLVSSSVASPLKDLLTSSCTEALPLCSLERTFSDVVGFPEKGIIIDYITRISSIIVLATLFLPFRRKFERRIRH